MYKVLNITEEGRGGGAIGRIRMIAQQLKDRIDTVIVVPKGSHQYIQSLDNQGISYLETSLHPMTTDLKGAILYVVCFIPEVVRLCIMIMKEKPDLVHCNGSWQIKGIIASKLVRAPSIWHMNDTYQWNFVERLFRLISWLPTGYIYASERTKGYYTGLSKRIIDKTHQATIVAPVDRCKIQPVNRKRHQPVQLLMIGYINIHKGIELLLRAASEVGVDDIQIDVVGPVLSTRRAYVDTLISLKQELGVTNVDFIGYQKVNNDLFSTYDYYICSSIRESSPMAVWESLSSGLPIISTDVGDVRRIVETYQCGVIAKELNGSSLAHAIRSVIHQSDDAYRTMSQNAVKASATFDKEIVAKDYLTFYNKMISEQRT